MSHTAVSKIFQSERDAIAVALYVMSSKGTIRYEALPHGRVRLTVDQGDVAWLNEKPASSYVYVQEGGSMSELYLHGHETEASAVAGRVDCASAGSYKTGAVVEVPPCLRALGEVFYETAQALVETVPGLTLNVEE
jgi:hypothetical protein